MVIFVQDLDIWQKFGAWVKDRRLAAKLTQSELAYRADITRQHVWNIENGVSGVKRQTVENIAIALNTPIKEALIAAGYLPETIAESRATYQTDIEIEEVVAAYQGIPENIRPTILAMMKAAIVEHERDKTTHGKKAE